jgi:hypothetical protein
MSGEIKILNCIVCDDARQEVGGKTLLIGVYAGAMFNPVVPFTVPTFAIYIEAKFSKKHYQHVLAQVVAPNGHQVSSPMGPVHIGNQNYPASLSFRPA